MRSYFRLDPQMVEKKLAAGYTPAQVGAFVMLLSQAEQQPQRGRFRSLVELRAAMDCMVEEAGPGAAMSKYVPFLLKQGDVVKLPDGGPYYVDGWDEWQEGNWQVAERMRRVRERKGGDGSPRPPVTRTDTRVVTGVVTPPVTPDVTAPVTVGVTPDVTARDARRLAAATAPIVAVAAGDVAVSRRRQAASETEPLPLPLTPEVERRAAEITEGCLEILAGRPLRRPERDLIQAWASTLRRGGELVPVPEILGVVRRQMTEPTPTGSLPAKLGWCADDVAALARERAGPAQALPRSVREAIDYDQAWAEHAERLRQEGL
jgi:hypothetical protein